MNKGIIKFNSVKYMILGLILLSCNHFDHKKKMKVADEILDTIKTKPPAVNAKPILFESAFMKGTTQPGRVAPIVMYGTTIGKISIRSGHIIACDPLHIDEYGIPFTQVFPTGEFPVQLAIAQAGDEDLVAFARIKFSDEPVIKWEPAIQGQESDKNLVGFGVDGGVAIFIDQDAVKQLDNKAVADFNGQVFQDMNKHYHNTWKFTMYHFGNNNLAAFTSGLGDGRYVCYIGFGANGAPCRLLVDFDLLDWKEK